MKITMKEVVSRSLFAGVSFAAFCLGTGCATYEHEWSPPPASHALFRGAATDAPNAAHSGMVGVARPSGELTIGAWNIEWLGSPLMREHQPAPEDLAAYIAFSGVDILGVEEMTLEDVKTRTNSTLSKALAIVDSKTGGRWTHRLFRERTGTTQVTGIAWDQTRVKLMRVVELPDTGHWDRVPHVAYFSAGDGRTDFAVVVLHMKANYEQLNGADRENEAKQLIPALKKNISEPDLLLIGDLNCKHAYEPAMKAYKAAGFTDLNATDKQTFIPPQSLDRALIRDSSVFQPESFHVVREDFIQPSNGVASEEDFKMRFSDHCMVTIKMTVGADQD